MVSGGFGMFGNNFSDNLRTENYLITEETLKRTHGVEVCEYKSNFNICNDEKCSHVFK